MSEIHVKIQSSDIHNPGVTALPVNAGQLVVATGSVLNKTATVHGQVPGTSVIAHNPA